MAYYGNVPSHLPVHLMMVTSTEDAECTASKKGNNKFYDMFEKNGQLVCYYGRVPDVPFRFGDEAFYNSIPRIAKKEYPLSQWQTKCAEKLKKGYKDMTVAVSSMIKAVNTSNNNNKDDDDYSEISNKEIAKIVARLQALANEVVKKNYTVNSREVTQEQVDLVQESLDKLQLYLKPVSDFYASLLSILSASGDKQHPIRRKTKISQIEKLFNDFQAGSRMNNIWFRLDSKNQMLVSECIWMVIEDEERYKDILLDIETKSNQNFFQNTFNTMMYFSKTFDFRFDFQGNDKKVFNDILKYIFAIVPRSMEKVDSNLANNLTDAFRRIIIEQDLLDVLRGQVIKIDNAIANTPTVVKKTNKKSILEINGLEMEECDDEDIALIKRKLGNDAGLFKNAWRIKNLKQEKQFLDYCKQEGISKRDCKLLWHGTRSCNIWSIFRTGLVLRPACGVANGHMFGAGLYFAPLARKSIGYTSLSGSYWSKGTDNTGFMILHSVAYGTPYDVYSFDSKYYNFDYKALKRVKPDANCLHAHAGTMLRNDEIIVYREDQIMPLYLVEIGR